PYLTLNKDFEATQIRVFAEMAMKGMIYKGLKPVYWSPSSESALAEAEIEYRERRDPAIFVAFDVVDGKGVLDAGDKMVIWTTTPWTIPANLAISVNANMEYVLVQTEKGNMVFMESLMESALKELELEQGEILKRFKGRD
ncbi:isoleucine--tRNA ligase, partial [Acinetobacter junii]